MARSRSKKEKDGERDEQVRPARKKAGKTSKPEKETKIQFRDIKDISGEVEIVGGDKIEHPTAAKTLKEFEANELEDLRVSVVELLRFLKERIDERLQEETSFHVGPLELNEGKYLLGREELLERLGRKLKSSHTVFLSGRGGVGRTSLLQAGLMPLLLKQGHLPVLLRLSGDALEPSIKRSLYTGVDSTTYLKGLKLAKFLEQAARFVPGDGQLVLLLDGYEYTGEDTPEERSQIQEFEQEWGLTRTNRRLRWLFSIDHGFTSRLSRFDQDAPLEVPPLERAAAALAIRGLQQAGLQVDELYTNEILDELAKHRGSLEDTRINPSDLQIVLRALAEGNAGRTLSKVYEKTKGVNGIFEKYLVRTVQAEFRPHERPSVWQILAFLGEEYPQPLSIEEIRSRMEAHRFETATVAELLNRLRRLHIIGAEEESYRLAHVNLMRGIRDYLDKQNLLASARAESLEELNNIRASSLRGMLAGALGLAVFRSIAGGPIPDLAANVWSTLLFTPVGGLAGLLLTFFVDVFIARYRGTRPWQRYLLSAATGFFTFALALALYVYLEEDIGDPFVQFARSIIVGGAWGAVTGAGIAWAMSSTPVPLWKIPVIAAAGALTLFLFDLLFPVLDRATDLEVLIGGFWFPLVIVAATVFWRPASPLHSFGRST